MNNNLCELCELKIRNNVQFEDDDLIVLDCASCEVPMIVWKEHTMELTKNMEIKMNAILEAYGFRIFGSQKFYIDRQQRAVLNHLHWHARPNSSTAH